MTYKQLVIDLLSKKVSPLIITGIVINEAQKCHKAHSSENFLIRQIKKDNPQAFVKCFSDKPHKVVAGGLAKLELSLVEMNVSFLILLPRVNESVVSTFEENKGTLQIAERQVELKGDF